MNLTYIFHSGFVLESDHAVIIFDYWLDPACVLPHFLQKQKPLYVLSSHFHEDHFSRHIFEWKNSRPDITYILSKDILRRHRAQKEDAQVWLAKGGSWEDGVVRIMATGSNDSGVSWILEIEGKRVFHAGDLNNWYAKFLMEGEGGPTIFSHEMGMGVNPWHEEKKYLGELKDIRKMAHSFDVVMFPVDGRIGNGYTRGARQFIDQFHVGLFVPMHFVASGNESAWRFREFTEPAGIRFWDIHYEGETIQCD